MRFFFIFLEKLLDKISRIQYILNINTAGDRRGGKANVRRKKKKGWTRGDKLTLLAVLIGATKLILTILSYFFE